MCPSSKLYIISTIHLLSRPSPNTLAQEHLSREVMKFTIMVDPFLVIITIYLICLFHAPE